MSRSPLVMTVIFEVTTESKRARFNIPKGVTKLLRLKAKDPIALVIRDAKSSVPLYAGIQKLKSGTEIYGAADVSNTISANHRIRVEASRSHQSF